MSASRGKPSTVTPTNAAIAQMVREGATHVQVGAELNMSVHAVKRRLDAGGYDFAGRIRVFAPNQPTADRDLGDRNYTWQSDAECVGLDPAMWDVESDADHNEGVRICQKECEVREQCLTAALEEEQTTAYITATIRGGMTPRERQALAKGLPIRNVNKCKNGHTRTAENTYKHTRGYKRCRDCDREQAQTRRSTTAA